LFFKFIGKNYPDYNDDRIIVQVFTPPMWVFNFFIINQGSFVKSPFAALSACGGELFTVPSKL